MSLFVKKAILPNFHFFSDEDLRAVRCLLSHGLTVEDGPVSAKGGLMIDGQLNRCRIVRTPGLLRISVLGCVQASLIECTDLLIEGLANGIVIAASGRIEITATAIVVGSILLGPQTRLHIAAGANVQDLSIKPINQAVPMTRHVKSASNAKATYAATS